MVSKHFTYRIRIKDHECGSDGRLSLKSLLDYFQYIASDHAVELGVGKDSVFEKRELWVLSRIKIGYCLPINAGDELELETYPSGTDLLFAVRQFAIRNLQGELVACGTSYWLLLDGTNFRPLRPNNCLPPLLLEQEPEEEFFHGLGKLAVQPIADERMERRVFYSDLDANVHLNNAHYGRFITDAIYGALGSVPTIRDIQINYNHQALLGDKLMCGLARNADGTLYVDGVSPDGKISYFQALVTLGDEAFISQTRH